MPPSRSRPQVSEFEREVLPHLSRLYAAAIRLTRSAPDAEDLVQETLLRALQSFPRFDATGSVRAWLYRILTNIFINAYRHERVVQRTADEAIAGSLDGTFYDRERDRRLSDPVTRHEFTHLSAPLEAAIATMDERFRKVLILADLMDFTYREIADQLGIPEGTVMSRLFRARRFLKQRLEPVALEPGCAVRSARLADRRSR